MNKTPLATLCIIVVLFLLALGFAVLFPSALRATEIYDTTSNEAVVLSLRWQGVLDADAAFQEAKAQIKEARHIDPAADLDFNPSFTRFVIYAPDETTPLFKVSRKQ